MSKTYTREEVKKHNIPGDLWVVLDNSVFDLTKFLHEHPGGEEVILDRAGGDATDCFNAVGHTTDAIERRKQYKIGDVPDNEKINNDVPEVENKEYPERREHTDFVADYLVPGGIIAIAAYLYFYQ